MAAKAYSVGAFLVMLWDITLDPAMSGLTGYWVWSETGLENLTGWFFTGVVVMLLLELLGGEWWGQQLSYPLMRSYFFWANSRSFSFASLAFPARQRRLVGLVYAFCRITDDIVDEGHGDAREVHRRLQDWLQDARNAYYGRSTANDWINELMQTSQAHGVPFSIIEELVRGVERDLDPPSFATVEDLKDYCYGVASTVGLWLCHLNDVRDEWMLDRAAALGRAMQITNIIRDVGEDLGRGRLYLPADVLRRHGLTPEALRAARERGEIPSSYDAVMKEMAELADQEYTLAWQAIPHLPRGFSTPTAVAADIYRGIQTVVARNGYDNLTRRARTSTVTKVALATRAWCRLRWRRLRHRFRAASIVSVVAALVLSMAAVPFDAAAYQADGRTLINLRSLYVEAGDEHDAIVEARALIDGLGEAERAEPVIEAYGAAFEVVRAKHAFWPFSKLKHVNRGLPVLDRLAEEHPKQVEVRFLRLVSCYYLPGIMGRKDTVREDLGALCTLLPRATAVFPEPWYRRMVSFVLGSAEIEDSCRLELQSILTARDLAPDPL
ncbi:MAG TPA: carotenoid biosynthesis protein, partial [Rhodothermia bacterium]